MKNEVALAEEVISRKIYLVRGDKMLMDSDLAELYGVPTKRLNEQVKRNIDRFPKDFMTRLNKKEWENLKSQNATSSAGGRRTPPYMFTEQGVAMLSSVLNSPQAIQVNISIMRVFVKMRKWAADHADLLSKIEALQKAEAQQNHQIEQLFDLFEELIRPQLSERNPIGFKTGKNS